MTDFEAKVQEILEEGFCGPVGEEAAQNYARILLSYARTQIEEEDAGWAPEVLATFKAVETMHKLADDFSNIMCSSPGFDRGSMKIGFIGGYQAAERVYRGEAPESPYRVKFPKA